MRQLVAFVRTALGDVPVFGRSQATMLSARVLTVFASWPGAQLPRVARRVPGARSAGLRRCGGTGAHLSNAKASFSCTPSMIMVPGCGGGGVRRRVSGAGGGGRRRATRRTRKAALAAQEKRRRLEQEMVVKEAGGGKFGARGDYNVGDEDEVQPWKLKGRRKRSRARQGGASGSAAAPGSLVRVVCLLAWVETPAVLSKCCGGTGWLLTDCAHATG